MTDRSKAITHADDCWSWGPAHYECAVREIERLREAVKLNMLNWQPMTRPQRQPVLLAPLLFLAGMAAGAAVAIALLALFDFA